MPTTGVTGQLRVHGLMALWLYALRAWERDESADLSGTMAAVDRGLDRAMQAERSMPGRAAGHRRAGAPPPDTAPMPLARSLAPPGRDVVECTGRARSIAPETADPGCRFARISIFRPGELVIGAHALERKCHV